MRRQVVVDSTHIPAQAERYEHFAVIDMKGQPWTLGTVTDALLEMAAQGVPSHAVITLRFGEHISAAWHTARPPVRVVDAQ